MTNVIRSNLPRKAWYQWICAFSGGALTMLTPLAWGPYYLLYILLFNYLQDIESTLLKAHFSFSWRVIRHWNFIGVCSLWSSIGLDNGLAPNRRQAIIWINADQVLWRTYATLWGMGGGGWGDGGEWGWVVVGVVVGWWWGVLIPSTNAWCKFNTLLTHCSIRTFIVFLTGVVKSVSLR